MERRIIVYDTTLRDGAQGEGVSFSLVDKLNLAKKLDEMHFDYIEGGYPASNPKDREFFKKVKEIPLEYAKVVAFGSTCRKNIKPEDDKNLQSLIKAETPAVTIFGKSSTLHVTDALGTTLDENLRMIFDSVAYLKDYGKEVIYDAEHFFDGFRLNKEYALKSLESAKNAGADYLVLCDTNGGTKSSYIRKIVRYVRKEFPKVRLGIHAHNDIGCGVANSLDAVYEGVEMVQGTINGLGERVGNADLINILGNLFKDEIPTKGKIDVSQLRYLSRLVYELVNLQPNERQPYVGNSAFAHKGGLHVDGVRKKGILYEHIRPETFGNKRRVLISELAGSANIEFLEEYGIDKEDKLAKRILRKIKEMEHQGYVYETAEGSLDLLIRNLRGETTKIFDYKTAEYLVLDSKTGDKKSVSNANVKLRVNGDVVTEMKYGDGPVNALDLALRAALTSKYPELKKLELVDYKVRTIPGRQKGTSSKVRVLIESEIYGKGFGTVGVSTDVEEASWQALVESYEFAHLQVKENRK